MASSIHLILLLARIYKLVSEAIDFVLASPHTELDVDIWMYPPIGFQVDTDYESKQSHLLKLNKSSWFETSKSELVQKAHTRLNRPWISFISK